jgi:hypothetical protein
MKATQIWLKSKSVEYGRVVLSGFKLVWSITVAGGTIGKKFNGLLGWQSYQPQ